MSLQKTKNKKQFLTRYSLLITGIRVLLCAVSLLVPSTVATKTISHTSPKLVNYFLSWGLTEAEARQLSEWDMVILDMEIQERSPELLKKLRQWNPDIILLVYITPQEIRTDAATSYSIMRRKLVSGIDDDWYLKDENGRKLSWWPETYLLNITNNAPVRSGIRLNDYMADFVSRELLSTGLWDGVFYDNSWDNITYFAGQHIDLDRNGSVDQGLDSAWREGLASLYTKTRVHAGQDIILIGNNNNSLYLGELNGKLLENFSLQTWAPFMNTARTLAEKHKSPQVPLINANTFNTGIESYQHMRFGLTSALLENVYYSYDFGDTNHGQTWRYDEYDVDLGNPIARATSQKGSSTYQPDVWRRDFEHGVALVNSNATAQTVTLGGDFEHIRGTQDTAVNNGSIVSEVSLAGADGRILLKTFETLQDVLFGNGDFVRFLRPDGSAVRNGFFVFEEGRNGGDQVAHIDMTGDGKRELFVVSRNKFMAWTYDGQPFINAVFPYTAQYAGSLRVMLGDVNHDNKMEIYVAPEAGYPAPIKVYTRYGFQLRDDWYPFGASYKGGYTLALGEFAPAETKHIVVGSGTGVEPKVGIYTWDYQFLNNWLAFESSFRGGVNVTTGDLDGNGIDEVVVGAGPGKAPLIRTFDKNGAVVYKEFQAYSTLSKSGITVRTQDVDFDGKDDILGFSSGF
jgi:hypothetical protein